MPYPLSLSSVVHEPRPGTPRVCGARSVVIVGGGLAGCAAAVVLAERGVRVTLLEAEPTLGGRVSAWADRLADGTPFEMERGFHAFFRQYYNVRALLRRLDPHLDRLVQLSDYPLLGPDGRAESFAGLPKHPLLGIAALVWRTPTMRLTDLARVAPLASLEMLSYEAARTFASLDHLTAAEYLDSLRFPPAARRMLFEVFAHSFFNPEDGMSAAEMLKMFHFYFTGNPDGLVFDVLDRPFSRGLWEPMLDWLVAHDVDVRLRSSVSRIERTSAGFRAVVQGAEPALGESVVLAVTVPALKSIVARSPNLDDASFRAAVAKLDVTLPFAVWRLWLDRPTAAGRQPFVGTAGLGLLDNISLYHLFQDESRAWANRTGGSVVELHAYAVPSGRTEAFIRDDLWTRLLGVYPELAGARVLDERFLVRQDCPAFQPGAWADRPQVATRMPGVLLAGDFVKLPVPAALMEGAVISGFMAANELLAPLAVRGEPIRSVPLRGLFRPVAPRRPAFASVGGAR